jgi:translation initiation factor 2 subunit 1
MVRRKGLPEWGEFILCTVKRITPYAAWCTLDEYPEVEAMIHVSEASGKWVHDIRDFVKVNKRYVAKVVKIDYQRNTVNLSLKRVNRQEEKEKMNQFHKEQRAEKILELAAKEFNKNLDQAYEEVGFLLQEKFGELSVAFDELRKSPDLLIKKGIPDQWIKALSDVLEKSIQEKEFILKADLEIKSFASDGVEDIRKVLGNFQKSCGCTVKYISAPIYRVELRTKDPKSGEKGLREGLDNVLKEIKKFDGEGNYKFVK